MKKEMFSDRFNLTEMVIDGSKLRTRRLAENNKKYIGYKIEDSLLYGKINSCIWEYVEPKYKVGEVVAIAQSYKTIYDEKGSHYIPTRITEDMPSWNNKLFVLPDAMPHQIKITDIKVERLQDISEEDCLKEGIRNDMMDSKGYSFSYKDESKKGCYEFFNKPRKAFASLINKICGKGTWERNPYIFAYEFKLIK
jgi:hypothetical protein